MRRIACRCALWPGKAVRTLELQRQYPFADKTFSLPCRNRVVEGDTIRWTAAKDLQKPWNIIEGDPPQIEAKVDSISSERDSAKDLVALRHRVRQEMSSLFTRGCV